MPSDEARLSAWHRSVYESYDEPADEDGWWCDDCGEWVDGDEHRCRRKAQP